MVKTETLKIKTKGNCDVVNITEQVGAAVAKTGISNATVTVFNVGSTAGITTTEYEPGLVNYDIAAVFEKIAPENGGMSTRRRGTTITGIRMFGHHCWGRV